MALCLAVAGVLAGPALAAPAAGSEVPKRIIFPVVGPASWTDDFGAPRWQGSHEGNDILAEWKAPAVAVEAGKVRIHTTSASAGCMLYLYGKSGTTYLYIHLNNDRTPKNDGKGGCKPGVAYAEGLETGDSVRAGELLGYVGSSGDAGATNHLHFERHPDDGRAVSPFRWLKQAEHLLYALPEDERAQAADQPATLTLTGRLKAIDVAPPEEAPAAEGGAEEPPPETAPDEGSALEPLPPASEPAASGPPPVIGVPRLAGGGTVIRIRVKAAELSVGGSFEVERTVVLTVPADVVVERERNGGTRPVTLDGAKKGELVTVTTTPTALGLRSQLARPRTLAAASVLLQGKPDA